MLGYLGRYTHRLAIANNGLVALDEDHVAFTWKDYRRILDEFVAKTGFHRKHAMWLLRCDSEGQTESRRNRPRIYQDAERNALMLLWEAADRVCGKRLKPL
ncbi:hypothetical protein ACVIN2_002919 [Bradyrhizobium sp. USDA 3650]